LHPDRDELGVMALLSDRSAAAVVHQDEVLLLPLESDGRFARRLPLGSHYQQLALHPHAEWMATATRDPKVIQVWNLAHVEGVNSSVPVPSTQYFNFSPDGKWLVACWAGEFQFYRVGDWRKRAFAIRRNPASNQHAPVAFTRDGRMAAIASSRYTIQLVRLPENDSTRPETIATLESPDRSPLEILAFSADGSRLAAATMNQLIQLWNLALLHDSLAELRLEGRWPASP
jgi:WD40 repeat protein